MQYEVCVDSEYGKNVECLLSLCIDHVEGLWNEIGKLWAAQSGKTIEPGRIVSPLSLLSVSSFWEKSKDAS